MTLKLLHHLNIFPADLHKLFCLLHSLLGGHGEVVGGHVVDKVFCVSVDEGAPQLDLKIGKEVVEEGKIRAKGGVWVFVAHPGHGYDEVALGALFTKKPPCLQ